MPRPIKALIDLAALRHNYVRSKQAAPQSKSWAVVKANAYGHGLDAAVHALEPVADGFALLELDGAVHLRESGVQQPILLLEGVFEPTDLHWAQAANLACVVHCEEQVSLLCAADAPVPGMLWIKLNTGMNRLGLRPERLPGVLEKLRALSSQPQLGLMTHFSDADGPSGVAEQLQVFNAAKAAVHWQGPISLANSAALLRFSESQGDWVRPGIMLYGGSPFGTAQSAQSLDLQAVMTLQANIVGVQNLQAGEHVGYGNAFTANAPMRVGIVACGYADGYPRHAPTGTPVAVHTSRGVVHTRTLGRVSMDMLCIDLTNIADAGMGSTVELWGVHNSADAVAEAAGTVSYELFCALTPRVPQVEV